MPNLDFNIDKLNDTFNSSVYYRELGNFVKQREEYDRSLKYFDQSLKKEPESVRALRGRATARAKAVKFKGAIEDINKILSIEPNNIYLLAEKALITYLGCEFEDALLQNNRNLPLRQKPDNFATGVMHCEDAILNSVSERAGKPLRDHFKIIREIAWAKNWEKQRPYKPMSKLRRKKRKSVYTVLPSSQTKEAQKEKLKRKKERRMRSIEHNEYLHSIQGRRQSSEGSKIFSGSMALVTEQSSIRDSLESHYSSLVNCKIPPAPIFPYRPLQRHTSNIENYLAERYLDKLYLDKSFLKSIPSTSGAHIANEKGSAKILQLANKGFRNVYLAQEMLRSRRPFYSIKYQESTTCGKLEERRNTTLKKLQETAIKQSDLMISRIETAINERRMRNIMEGVEKFVNFYESTPKRVFPSRQTYLSTMIDLLCTGYYDLRMFTKDMTDMQRDTRIRWTLGIPMDKFPSDDSLAKDLKEWYIDWKKMDKIYQSRLFKATTPKEFSWLYHELSRISYELKQYEMARMYARKCIGEASVGKYLKWILNSALLIAKIDITQKNKNDAKNQVKYAKKIANRLRDDNMVDFLERCVEIIEESAIDEALGMKVLEMRQRQIITLLTSQKMKDEAEYLFKRISNLPVSKRMSVMPGFSFAATKDEQKATASSVSTTSAESRVSSAARKKNERSRDRGVSFLKML